MKSSRWGNGYVSVNDAGHVQVHPTKDPAKAIDLKELVDRLQPEASASRPDSVHRHPEASTGRHSRGFPDRHRTAPVPGGYSCVYPSR